MKTFTKGLFILVLPFCSTAFAQFQYISPLPGSRYHNVNRNIMLREGETVDEISLSQPHLFNITGSKSGDHDFAITLAGDGKTILLQPSENFAFEEIVTVTVKKGIKTLNGKTVDGTSFFFYTRKKPLEEDEKQFIAFRKKMLEDEFGQTENATTKEDSAGNAPPYTINVNKDPAPGDVFFHHYSLLGMPTDKMLIMESDGNAVYSHPSLVTGINFTINHNGYITMYNSLTGLYEMYDSSFNKKDTYEAGNGYTTDIHDFQIFPDGHSYMVGLDYQTIDMSVYDPTYSTHANVVGAIVQELDKQKHVIFEWRSWDYIDITEALHEIMWISFIDYVHANSIEEDVDGNILLSCRNLDQVIKINKNTGDMMWRLGGIKNDFTFVNDTFGFTYQHDVRRIDNGNLTLFDNGTYHTLMKCSFAREYKLDEVNKTATLVWSYKHPAINGQPVYGSALGSVQRLANGNTLINWGWIAPTSNFPNLTEVNMQGEIEWEMTLANQYQDVIYRAHRFEWEPCARPTGKLLSSKAITFSSEKLSWGKTTGALQYNLQYRKAGTITWTTVKSKGTSKTISNLLPATGYEWQVQSVCDSTGNTFSPFSITRQFTTLPQKVENEVAGMEMKVYPNPASEIVKVNLAGDWEGSTTIELFNSAGAIVYQHTFQDVDLTQSLDIFVKEFSPGIYLLRAYNGAQQQAMKVAINH